MSKITKCDICGKTFDGGFLIDVSRQGGFDFIDSTKDRFEIGQRDICRDCYYKIKEIASTINRGEE